MDFTGNGIQNWFLKEIELFIYYVKRPLRCLLKEIPKSHLFHLGFKTPACTQHMTQLMFSSLTFFLPPPCPQASFLSPHKGGCIPSLRDALKKNGLFSDIDKKGGQVSCRNHYFLKPQKQGHIFRQMGVWRGCHYFKTDFQGCTLPPQKTQGPKFCKMVNGHALFFWRPSLNC